MTTEINNNNPEWDDKKRYSRKTTTRFYWLIWAVFGFAIAIFEFIKSWRLIHKRAALVCILLSFFLMQMLEGFAVLKGLWTWNSEAVLGFLGNIPYSEWLVYIMSPMVAVGTIEFTRYLLMKKNGVLKAYLASVKKKSPQV